MGIYYADTDDNGVLCVDQLNPDGTLDGKPWTVDGAAGLAESYPTTIYFAYPEPV